MKNFGDQVKKNYPFKLSLSRDVENAYIAYETSFETDNLESEENRKIYGELIDCDWGKDWNREYKTISNKYSKKSTAIVTDDDDDDIDGKKQVKQEELSKWWRKIEFGKSNQPKSLKLLSLEAHAKNFNGGNIDERILCQDAIEFGYLTNITLPFSQSLLEFNNEIFWKRIVTLKMKNPLKLERLFRAKDTDWKRIAVELFAAEYYENLKPSEYKFIKKHENLQLWSKFIRDLDIRKVQPEKKQLQNEFNADIKTVNYMPEECSHFLFDSIGQLSNIERLSISYKSAFLDRNYERRFFNVSPKDIRQLSIGLVKLTKLQELEITETNLEEDKKIEHLLKSIEQLKSLRILTLTHCKINSEYSGGHFQKFLTQNSSLEKLDLSYNDLSVEFCEQFALGIENFSHKLLYLGLSMTGIFYNGLDCILKSISKSDVYELNISCCQGILYQENNSVIDELENLIKSSRNLQKMNLSGNKILEQSERDLIIDALIVNYHLKSIDLFHCDFTTNDQVKIKVLMERNDYYHKNPILKKEKFSHEDEGEIEKWLRRVKNPLILKLRKEFSPTVNSIKWKNEAAEKICEEPIENYEKYASVSK